MFNNEYPYGYGEYGDHSRRPYYNDESEYNTNAPSYYDDLSRKQKLIKYLAEKVGNYDVEMEKRFKEWDELISKFPENVEKLLIEWMEDGTLDKIINENIFNDLNGKTNQLTQDVSVLFKRTIGMKSAIELGAVGNGITNETKIFEKIEKDFEGTPIDLAGKTYVVDKFPTKNYYIDGKFIVNGKEYGSGYISHFQASNPNVFIGRNSGKNFTPDLTYFNTTGGGHNLTAIGESALSSANEYTRNSTALGAQALKTSMIGRYNVAIGYAALRDVNGELGDAFLGTRNVAVGDHAMLFLTKGYSNVAMGRNALQILSTGRFNTAIGSGAMSGYAPLDLDGKTVTFHFPNTESEQTAMGTEALMLSNALGNTAIGSKSGRLVKTGGRNTALGYETLTSLEENRYFDGREIVLENKSGTYSKVDRNISVTILEHGLKAGDTILFSLNGTEPSYNDVTGIINSDRFTIQSRVNLDNINNTGACSFKEIIKKGTNIDPSNDNVAIGVRSMKMSKKANFNTAVGGISLINSNGQGNTSIGYLSSENLDKGNYNTALGYAALRFMEDGSPLTNVNNATAIGYNARVTGSNQLQLGDGQTNVYTYGAYQTRSDKRDKADIKDTALGLEFINKLRPVDYKWNYRADYIEIDHETGEVTKKENDGSKKRNRFHHGLLAQEVKEVIDELGVDFGGYQDHSVNGGGDVLSIGYEELIAPLIKSVQELTNQVNDLKEEIKELKGV